MFDGDGSVAKSEFIINSTTTGEQRQPVIAMEDDGNFVVVWSSPDADGYGINAQRFDATGTAQGGEISVNSTTANTQNYPETKLYIAL